MTMRVFHVRCPSCSTEFPIDPEKVPAGGVAAICSMCDRVFPVQRPAEASGSVPAPAPEPPALDLGGPVGDLLGEGELQITLDPTPAPPPAPAPEPVAPPPPPEPLKKTHIPMPKGQPPFVDMSSFADETLAGSDAGTPSRPAASGLSAAKERFGKRDPHERARHLARVLVSDIIAYYPVRYQESLAKGTLKEDFDAEVKKSWKEYVDQVGIEMAESTPYFNEALNEVLARGKSVF